MKNMKLHERLRYLRESRGLTLKQVGEALGVAYQSVMQYESGQSEPRLSKLPILVELFKVDIYELLGIEKDYSSEFPYADAVAHLPKHSMDRATAIYQLVGEEFEIFGLHCFADEVTNGFLEGRIGDLEFYRHAKAQVESMAQQMLEHRRKKMSRKKKKS